MKIIVNRGKKELVMDESLQLIMNPRKLSNEDDMGDVRILKEDDVSIDMENLLGGSDEDEVLSDEASEENESEEDNNDTIPPPQQPSWSKPSPPVDSFPRTKEDVNNAKRELLYRFDRLEKKGIRLPRRYSMASDLTDMQVDYDRLVRDRDADAGIKFQKKVLIAVVGGIEFLNKKFDPFDFYLDGWGETVNENLTDYDDVLEELHAKYKGKAKMAPELKLLFLLLGSAFMYHMTNTMFKSVPGLGQVVKDNPDLMKQFAAATANTMQKSDDTGMAGLFSGLFGGGNNSPPPPPPDAAPQSMRGPSSTRVAEVQRFMQNQGSGGVPRPTSRPPLPEMGRDTKPIKDMGMPSKPVSKPQPSRDLRPDPDDDLVEIFSTGSESGISEVTSGGGRRKKRILEL
ncbi:hypothetical protein TetV_047 [Tetraselmis virus 1]|uniref:Uncharacterized protein n=1 Tax=Tetraselmis virus 1 TaxID=2060617 RepID=A0A2P0VN26_9VIRU|nr:hypothetical protein QJ968_gp047 [Tetraselmis virus 1]AUF82139.1 hypothetical protein TetV_047 [Tetraselmis virus 1]